MSPEKSNSQASGHGQRAGGLMSVVDGLLTRCGELADLALDCLLTGWDVFHTTQQFARRTFATVSKSSQWLAWGTLWSALQAGRTRCQRCSPFGRLSVLDIAESGSYAEGLSDLNLGCQSSSDFDYMYEIGPFCWWSAGRANHERDSSAESTVQDSASAPLMLAVCSASQPGFVRLWQAPEPSCLHMAPLEFSAEPILRQIMFQLWRVLVRPDAEVTVNGPAVKVSRPGEDYGGVDHVPCLHLPEWPAEEFLVRHRVSDFPPPLARWNICQFGVHLVPIGSRGSTWELNEWRLSFSRAELITAWHLTDVQRAALKAVKTLRNAVIADSKKYLKSYFIKTAVFWLCQDMPENCWSSVTEAVRMILDCLEAAVAVGRLPNFFWEDINLLRCLSVDEMTSMSEMISLMRLHMTRLLMTWCVRNLRPSLQPIPERPAEPLSERQLRLCLVRGLVLGALSDSIEYRPNAPCWKHWCASKIPSLLRLSAVVELEWYHHWGLGTYRLQQDLLQAMTVAPDNLVGGAHLTSLGGGMFSWDAAPLLALLTNTDLERLLGDPAAVRAWCRQQLSRPPAEWPAGLTAELDTPRGRAELLLNPQLLVRACSESVPGWAAQLVRADDEEQQVWCSSFPKLLTFEKLRQRLSALCSLDLEAELSRWLDEATASTLARHWREALVGLLSDPCLRTRYDRLRTCLPDRWQLRQYAFSDIS